MSARAGHPEDVYGKALPTVRDLGIGPTMAARVVGETLCTIGRGELRTTDISSPAAPIVVGTLSGLGNTRQIAVKDGIAYITSREDGVFIVDVRKRDTPALLCHYDPIEVATGIDVSGDVMFVACRGHGVELVDVSDPRKPFFVAHCQLPYVLRRGSRFMRGGKLPGFVGGLALGKDHVYVAGGWTDLHVVAAPGLAKPCRRRPGLLPGILPFTPRRSKRFRIYRPEGQVRAVDFMGDTAIIAAGSGGIQMVQVWPQFRLLGEYETKGFAMEVTTLGDHVYAAEEKGGLSIWQQDDRGRLDLVGRYKPRGHIVRDVVVPKRGKYAIVQVDLSILDFLDISDPAKPKRVFRDKGHGFVYHIGRDLIDARQVCVLWQLGGLRWYDLYGGPGPKLSGEYAHRLGGGGTVPYQDKRLVVCRPGFLTIGPKEGRAPGELALQRVPKCRLRGKPLLADGKLHLSSRTTGDVTIVDLADPGKPKLVEQFNVPGNPGRLVKHNGALVIPNGYEGLWVERTESAGR